MRKKILITGGAGFIGSNLIRSLNHKEWEIIVIDSLIPQVHSSGKWEVPEGVIFFQADIREKEAVAKALNKVEYIVHLAAETGVGQSSYEIARYVGTNEYGTAVLLEQASKLESLKSVVLASSRAVYGEGRYRCDNCGDVFPAAREKNDLSSGIWEHSCPVCKTALEPAASTEDQPLSPASCYAITKHNQEELLSFFSYTFNVPAVALRFQNVYGPGQSLTNPYTGILSIFNTRVFAGNPVLIYEDGNETRDFVYVDDVVQSICLALGSKTPGFSIYNVGSGKNIPVVEVARTLVDLMNSRSSVDIVGQFRVGDIRHAWADLSKINKELGFVPRIDLRKGLQSFVKWANKQPSRVDLYETMEKEMIEKGLMGNGKKK